MTELSASYNAKDYEDRIYQAWLDADYFHADAASSKPPYTIVIPPPNVTDRLHMGHGLNNTIQDIFIRWKRMAGYEACWLPGTDHAGIATQMMVEKDLRKKGKTKEDLGRAAFIEVLKQWKEDNGSVIIEQLKKLGCSCDWEREAYTLSDELSQAVRKIFVDLYEKDLIYRGERLVNWDTELLTAVSDDEVVNEERSGQIWRFRYPIADSDEFIAIETTRPETMLGDTAVAVHPDDERYQHLIGKEAVLPFAERRIPIVADDYVKSEFGTGAVKITPAHDPNDFELGKRHQLPMINVMNPDGTMSADVPAPFAGLDRFEARKAILKELKAKELFDEEKSHKLTVPLSDRSKSIIEPRLSKQWYVKMQSLAQPAVAAAKDGDLNFHPDLWKKTYLHWLENIQDWCISRQLWWGHRIPIWHCADCGKQTCAMTDPTECQHCQSKQIEQDPDVLDTWFSSWLWPLSPFGWPEETADLKKFFPSDLLVTGPDIIFLWVARMAMVSLNQKGKVPFKDVYFNSIICDKQGRKFSKTLGNGIDPLEMIDKVGADAVRFTCVSLAPLGGRVRMEKSDFDVGGRFINKLWNASRFILSKVPSDYEPQALNEANLDVAGKWLLHDFRQAALAMHEQLDGFRLNDAVDTVYKFIWNSFCDWAIEVSKEDLAGDGAKRQATLDLMLYVLEGTLRLAHPVIPFVTEEIWSKLPRSPAWQAAPSLCIAEFPQADKLQAYPQEALLWEQVQSLITGVRSLRAQAEIAPKDKVALHIRANAELVATFNEAKPWIQKLAAVDEFHCAADLERPGQCLVSVHKAFTAYVPAAGLMDVAKEKARLEGEQQRIAKIVKGLQGKLGNKNFVDRAPPEVVAESKEKLANMEFQLQALAQNIESLS